MTHAFHDEIQALLRGEKLQFDHARECDGWEDLDPELHDHAASHLLSGRKTAYQFRLKPRTVKIGSREVEAPVLEPGDRQMVWCWDSDFNKPEEQHADGGVAKDQFKLGLCFASEEACRAAHDAIHALLRGEA